MVDVMPYSTKPCKFKREAAILKCVAEGKPPPIEIAAGDDLTTVPLIVTSAVIETGPATEPLLSIVPALPSTEVITDVGVMNSPPLGPFMVNVTVKPPMGSPLLSFTLYSISDISVCPAPLMPIT